MQVDFPVGHAAAVAGLAAGFPWTEQVANSLVVREPIGVHPVELPPAAGILHPGTQDAASPRERAGQRVWLRRYQLLRRGVRLRAP
jgi:hypothetical protein